MNNLYQLINAGIDEELVESDMNLLRIILFGTCLTRCAFVVLSFVIGKPYEPSVWGSFSMSCLILSLIIHLTMRKSVNETSEEDEVRLFYVIAKYIEIEECFDLQYSHDIFHCGEATGNPHVFDSEEDAEEFKEENGIEGVVMALPVINSI